MANLQKTTALKFRRRNSCPDGWLHAGAKVPIRLAVRQEEYCRQAIDIHRFCYNLTVRTHRSCRRNRLPWPSWMDISKAFNAGKREDHPFVTQGAAIVLACPQTHRSKLRESPARASDPAIGRRGLTPRNGSNNIPALNLAQR